MTDRAGPPTPRRAPYDTRYGQRDHEFALWRVDHADAPGVTMAIVRDAFNEGWAARKLHDYRVALGINPPCREPLDKMVRPVSSIFPTEKEINDAS